jgi:gliding motility-associated-like protein
VATVNSINATCAGNCNGSATLTISGGQTPYQTPVWSTGITANSISNLCPNSYSVQVTDANGCTTTANFAIQEDAGFTLSTTGAGSICSGQSTTITASGATTYQWDNGLGTGSSFVVNPTTTTTYNVTGTTGNCSSSAAVTVTVVPTPSINAGIDQIVCVGQSVTLTAVGANQLDWDNGIANGQAFVPGVGETIYTVTGTTNGCSASDQVTVTVVPDLTVDAGDDQVICTGQSILLAATGANQYAWSNGVANGSVVIPPNGVKTYTVIGTSGTCSGSDQLTVIVEDCGWELEMPNVFSPNGDNANDLFVPLNKVNVVVERFEIFNRWGNLMYASSDQNISWDGKDQAGNMATEGVYFFKLRFTDGSQVKHEIHGFVHLLK